MATTKKVFKKVSNDLNIWKPKKEKDGLEILVTSINPNGKFGLQVRGVDNNGEVWTLPAHKWLQTALGGVPIMTVNKTVLEIIFTGKRKSKNYPTPTETYDLGYRDVESGEYGM